MKHYIYTVLARQLVKTILASGELVLEFMGWRESGIKDLWLQKQKEVNKSMGAPNLKVATLKFWKRKLQQVVV